ncbi:SPFH domain-containing protein [Aetokthonos hydrillicola Thurmond2011]|jgi:regulator of protease activity HflC (stomatin/prohibitin superfamily)|uniref:SPFH domain-containing protein n=1 Tax=Aetokthonos hydrillicola Thurmond2011 TaxID=2712845 RepID=A0AAP5IDE7_9CYAN|nr:slipin family protein [Aetokthonos hydrillicola]MBW4585715.1 slipin family protein [Aetokthonos hydrillicola CCALA 1050]MDR9899219.1 SPFH domain-containing protein [Aetokthonos hydrillicola Thurmond2011]
MWKTFYIKPHEIGILYRRSDFQKILQPGHYTYFGRHWRVQTHDLNNPEAKIENLELLLRKHGSALQQYLLVVRTTFNQAALVRCGQNWLSILPNQLRAFWRGFIDVESYVFNLEESLELPADIVQQIRDINWTVLKKIEISEYEIGLLYIQNNFVRPLARGEYGFWSVNRDVSVRILSRIIPNPDFPLEDVLIKQHPDFVAAYCNMVQLTSQQVAIVRYQGKVISILPPSSRKLFWQEVEVEIIDITTDAKLPHHLVAELVSGLPQALSLSQNYLHILEVSSQHVGLLYLNQEFQTELQPGIHAWWIFGRSIRTEVIDLRLQVIEVSGQDILSKDKVPLRLNLTAGFRILNALQAKNGLSDISGFLYKELQFALRGAVGQRTLDALLEDKGAIDKSVAEYIHEKTANYGIEIDSVGVKDIILPGEIKNILSKVVEAEKSAQANIVRRREETAATRSMLNTAKVMEDNPIALRLKELEVLERIAEKIERIQVNGSLDNILTDLIRISK